MREQKVARLPGNIPDQNKNGTAQFGPLDNKKINSKYQLEAQMNQNLMKEFEGMCLDGGESDNISGFAFDNSASLTEKKRHSQLPVVDNRFNGIPTKKKSKTGATATRPRAGQENSGRNHMSVSSFEPNNVSVQNISMYNQPKRPGRLPPTQPPKFVTQNSAKGLLNKFEVPIKQYNKMSRQSLNPQIARMSPMPQMAAYQVGESAHLPKGISKKKAKPTSEVRGSKGQGGALAPINRIKSDSSQPNFLRMKRTSSEVRQSGPVKLLTSQASIMSSVCGHTGAEHIMNCDKYHNEPVHAAEAQMKHVGRACGCQLHALPDHSLEDHEHSSNSEKWNQKYLSSGVCRLHRLTRCPKCRSSASPSISHSRSRSGSMATPDRGGFISNKILRKKSLAPKTIEVDAPPPRLKVMSNHAPKRNVIPDKQRTLTPKYSEIPSRQKPASSRNSNARSSTIVHDSTGADLYLPRNDPYDLPSGLPSTTKSKMKRNEIPYMCASCGKTTQKHSLFVKHVQTCGMAEGAAANTEVTYMCPGCSKVYSRHETYLKHVTQCRPNQDEYGIPGDSYVAGKNGLKSRPPSSSRYSANGPQLRDKFDNFKRFGNRPGSHAPKVNKMKPVDHNNLAQMHKTGDNFGPTHSHRDTLTGEGGRKALIDRISTAQSNHSRLQRLQTAKSIQQVDPDKHSIVDSAIRKIAKEWEDARPEQDAFWQKFEDQKPDQDMVSEQKMAMRATRHLQNQDLLLSKQMAVMKQLTDRDAASVFGPTPKTDVLYNQDSFLEGEVIEGDEPCMPNFDDMCFFENQQEMPPNIFAQLQSATPTNADNYQDEAQPPAIPAKSRESQRPVQHPHQSPSKGSNLEPLPGTIEEQSSHPSNSLQVAPSNRLRGPRDSEVPSDEDNDGQVDEDADEYDDEEELAKESAALKSQGRVTNYDDWLEKQAHEAQLARHVNAPERPTSTHMRRPEQELDGILIDAQASEGPPRVLEDIPTPAPLYDPPRTAEPYQNAAPPLKNGNSSSSSKGILKKPRQLPTNPSSESRPLNVHASIRQFLDAEGSSGDEGVHIQDQKKDPVRQTAPIHYPPVSNGHDYTESRNASGEHLKVTSSTFNDRVTFSESGTGDQAKLPQLGRPPKSPEKVNKAKTQPLKILNSQQTSYPNTAETHKRAYQTAIWTWHGPKWISKALTPQLGQPPSMKQLNPYAPEELDLDEDPYQPRQTLTAGDESQETNAVLKECQEQMVNKARPSTQNNKTNPRKELIMNYSGEQQAMCKASRTFLQGMHATDEKNQPPVNDYVNINDQIFEKAQDYDPSNEGMSASFYRMKEQKAEKQVPASRLYEADVSADNTSDNVEKVQLMRKQQAMKQMAVQHQKQLAYKSSQISIQSDSPDKKYVSPVKRINKNASQLTILQQSAASRQASGERDSVERSVNHSSNRLFKQETFSSLAKKNDPLGYSGKGIKPPKPFKIKKVSIQPSDPNPMELAENDYDDSLLENPLKLPVEPSLPELPLREPKYIREPHAQPAEPRSMPPPLEPCLHATEIRADLNNESDPMHTLPPEEPLLDTDKPLKLNNPEPDSEPSEAPADFYENESSRPMPDYYEIETGLKNTGRNMMSVVSSTVQQSIIPDGDGTFRDGEEFKSQGCGTATGDFGEYVEDSDNDEDDDRFESTKHINSDKCTVGIQTSSKYFQKVEKTRTFQLKKQARNQSVDWAESTLYNDEVFAKKKNLFFKNFNVDVGNGHEEGGNQVEAEEIELETQLQILSATECAYNVDFLKRKIQGREKLKEDKLHELFSLGLNTLEATMRLLKLQAEWDYNTKPLYQQELANQMSESKQKTGHMDAHMVIKLLTRCKRMYDCKLIMTRILRLVITRQNAKKELRILGNREHDPEEYKKKYKDFRLLTQRLQAQINTLQEEHKIFKRPFIFYGKDYIQQLKEENSLLSQNFNCKYYIEESFTTKIAQQIDKQVTKQERIQKHQEQVQSLQQQLFTQKTTYKTTSSVVTQQQQYQ